MKKEILENTAKFSSKIMTFFRTLKFQSIYTFSMKKRINPLLR